LVRAAQTPPLRPVDVIDADPVALDDPEQKFLAAIVLALREQNTDNAIAHALAHLTAHPKNPALLNLIGALYLQKQDDRSAEKYLIQASRIAPQDPKIINNLACVALLRRSYKLAATQLAAWSRKHAPGFAEYYYNMALAAFEQDDHQAAETYIDLADGLEHLVDTAVLRVLNSYKQFGAEAAEAVATQMLERFPNAVILYFYRGGMRTMGQPSRTKILEAILDISHAIRLEPQNRYFALAYTFFVKNIGFEDYNADQAGILGQVITMPGVDLVMLANPWQTLFVKSPGWRDVFDQIETLDLEAANAAIYTLKADGHLTAPFVLNGLRTMPLRFAHCEKLLALFRQAYLNRTLAAPETIDDADRAFMAALGCLCHTNEYAFYVSADETSALEQTMAQFKSKPRDLTMLLVLNMYEPLTNLLNEAAIGDWRDQPLLTQAIRQQIDEPAQERALMPTIPTLTPINDDVSKMVEAMYMENPYPAWKSVNHSGNTDHLFLDPDRNRRIQVLIAGCGTGHHAISTALMYRNLQIMAIDLSKRSLAYAKRKTEEIGLSNIEYAQADILELGSLKQRFDVIESVGVLHHLADPLKGLDVLLGLLKSRGLFRLGLYSETARAAMVAARQAVADMGYASTPEGIRQFRHDVLNNPTTHPAAKIILSGDFYGISVCRDLVFHVQETRYSLPQISEILRTRGLAFRGFSLDHGPMEDFRKMYPGGQDDHNLDAWHKFEQNNPDTFANMYQFWAQKIT
jgi:2-polyprenyl-3-methyl-5-hydroxy-6-metoxy-1,4-benzoquinol methylase/tetratricopeptide (TPR) repeat protein